jgi:hypothetical protein
VQPGGLRLEVEAFKPEPQDVHRNLDAGSREGSLRSRVPASPHTLRELPGKGDQRDSISLTASVCVREQADSATAAEVVEAAVEVLEGAPLWVILLEYVVLAGGYLVVAPVRALPSLTAAHLRA